MDTVGGSAECGCRLDVSRRINRCLRAEVSVSVFAKEASVGSGDRVLSAGVGNDIPRLSVSRSRRQWSVNLVLSGDKLTPETVGLQWISCVGR